MQRVLALPHVVHAFQQEFPRRHDGLVGSGNVLPGTVLNRSLSLDRPTIVVQKISSQARESISPIHLVAILQITIRSRAGPMVIFADGGPAISHLTVRKRT